MELSIIQTDKNTHSMIFTYFTMTMCGAMLLTYIHVNYLFNRDNKTIDKVATTVKVTETIPVKRLRPKVAPVQVLKKIEIEDKIQTDDPYTSKNYMSTILNNNDDIIIIIRLLNNNTMNCSAKYINERIRITECSYIPSLVGCPFHTPTKFQFRLIALLKNTQYTPIKQDIWTQMFVNRNEKLVSIASLK